MRSFFVISIAILVTTPVTAVHGQARIEGELRPPARVRYLVPNASRAFTGVVERVDSAGILVRPDDYDRSIHLGFDSLQSLAVFGGLRSPPDGAARGAAGGFKLGILIGAVATTAVWLSSADERCQDCWVSATGVAAVFSVFGALSLGILGGILGAAAPGEVWHEIPLRERRL